MRWIVETSLRFRFLVVGFAVMLLIYGITQIGGMPVDVFPEFSPPKVEIQTSSIGLSAVEVEELVTVPLEQTLNGVPGLDLMRSRSVPDLSDIVLLFKPGTDEILARQLVQERLLTAASTLPTWAKPPVIVQPMSSTTRVMKIGISSQEHDLMDLSMVAYWKIRARLLRVPGVANVPIWGERSKTLQVLVDPQLLRDYNVTLDEVTDVTARSLNTGTLPSTYASVIGTGGFIDTPNQRIGVQHKLAIREPEALGRITINDRIKEPDTPLTLADVADIQWGTGPLTGDAVINGGPGLMLVVQKLPWANTLDVTRGVEAAIDEMRPGLPGYEIDTTLFRPATFVELAIDNLTESLLIGGLLVVLILLLFLFEWRAALISATIIPLSLVFSLLVLSLTGATINVMTLAGLAIAIGAVVDDAIVDVENIVRRLRQLRQEGRTTSIMETIADASVEVRGAIVNASLIEISALLPVFFLDGLSGSFFRPLAQAYVVAGLVSPLIALTVTPALVAILLGKAPISPRPSPIVPWLQRRYDRILKPIVAQPRRAYIAMGAIVLAGLSVLPFLGQDLLPAFKERDFLMHWITNAGTSQPEMVRITERACTELLSIPGVRNCGSHIGQATLADEPYGINFTENWVSIEPSADYDATVRKIQETVDGYPGLIRDVQTYLKERIREVLTGSSDAVVIRIYGEDLHVLQSKAHEVQQALKDIDGIADLKVEAHSDIPQVKVELDPVTAGIYGISPGDARRTTSLLVAGEKVGDIFLDGKDYAVTVWSKPETRHSVTSIRELLIETPGRGHVRLGKIADVRIQPTPNVIERVGQSRKIDVSANVRDRALGVVAQDVERAVRSIEFPLGYHAEVLGENVERQAAQRRLLIAGLVAAIVILFLLYTSFQNMRLALLTFSTLPWAFVGGLLTTFFINGGILTLGSLVGLFTVLGIATRNGIMMISHFQHLEVEEGKPFGPELVLQGARERLAPILMTALTTGLALVPLVIRGNIPGQEIEYPMAIVILGGLLTSTLLNLLIVPSLYLRFGKRSYSTQPA